jgi:hypothetical protein
MKTPRIVAHIVVPADQHAPEASHPTRRPLHDPPPRPTSASCFSALASSPRAQRCAVHPNAARKSRTSSSSSPVSQPSPWGVAGVGADHLTGILSIVSRTLLTSYRCAPATARPMGPPPPSMRTRRVAPSFPRSVGCLPTFFPQGGLGSWRHPSRALPRQARARPQRPPGHSSTAPGKHQPPSTLGSARGGTMGADVRLRPRLPLAASAAPEEQFASSRRVGLFISVAK